jgi:hypothetical protein
VPLNGAIGPRPSLRQWADARIAHSEVTARVVDVSRAVACQPGIVRLDGIISGLPTRHRPSTQGFNVGFPQISRSVWLSTRREARHDVLRRLRRFGRCADFWRWG